MIFRNGRFEESQPCQQGVCTCWFRLLILTFLLVLIGGIVSPVDAQDEPFTCVVCGKRMLSGKYYRHPAGPVCEICAELPNRCSLCGLPIKDDFTKTPDGRFICKYDLPKTIRSEAEVQRLFEDVHNGLYRMTAGELKLKYSNVAISLFDVDYWNYRDGNPIPENMRRLGFSQSRPTGDTLTHSVVLLSGQFKGDTESVCAHEFMHLWINENKARARNIEEDTLEGLCELTAYKWFVFKENAAQQEKILENNYTHGRIKLLVGLEKDYGFQAIQDWIKRGTNAVVDANSLVQLGSTKIGTPSNDTLAQRTQGPPQTLKLLGVIGSKTNRCALINNRPFFENDEKELALASGTVLVKCLEIRTDTVRISVAGTNESMTLTLGGQ